MIFFGTGTSGCVPSINCLTLPIVTCKVCLDSLKPDSKHKRLNTSVLFRASNTDGRIRNILLDCGKTFYTQAVQWCSKYKIRELDGVFLTHNHADAMLGLDDLRQWTLNRNIQDKVNIYLNEETYKTVMNVFPYLVDTSKATGGGDVAGLNFIILKKSATEENQYSAVDIDGITIQPFPVEHGKDGSSPFYALAFKVNNHVYMSDVSKVPESSRKYLNDVDVFVVDALSHKGHISHFSVDQAVEEIYKVQPKRAYLTGFSHQIYHDEEQESLDSRTGKKGWINLAYDGLKIDL